MRAFTGLTLIDGTTRAPVPNATIVVRDVECLDGEVLHRDAEGLEKRDLFSRAASVNLSFEHFSHLAVIVIVR